MKPMFLMFLLGIFIGCSEDKSPTDSRPKSLEKILIGSWAVSEEGTEVLITTFKADGTAESRGEVLGVVFAWTSTWELEGDILITRDVESGEVLVSRLEAIGENLIISRPLVDGVETGNSYSYARVIE